MKRKHYLPMYIISFACVSLLGIGYASFVMTNEDALSNSFDIQVGEVKDLPGFVVASKADEVVIGRYFYQDLKNKTTNAEAKITYTIQVDPAQILAFLQVPSGESNFGFTILSRVAAYTDQAILDGWKDVTIESLSPELLIAESLTPEDNNTLGTSKLTFDIPQAGISTVQLSYTLKSDFVRSVNEIGTPSKPLGQLIFQFSLFAMEEEA